MPGLRAKAIVERTGCTQKFAKQMVDSFFSVMRERLMEGNRIEIRGFAAWTVKKTHPKPNARTRHK